MHTPPDISWPDFPGPDFRVTISAFKKRHEEAAMRAKIFLVLFVFIFTATANAQESSSAAESVDKLRAQLLDVQAKEEELRARAQQLDESLKPENIERSLA